MSRIMLVDDDGDMARITGRWLEKAGHEVTLAVSGSCRMLFMSSSPFIPGIS